MLIDSTDNTFRVRDVGSSNGTFLNDKRVEVHLLQDGDIVRAGSSTFSISILEHGENPHRIDGTSFGKTVARLSSESSTSTGTMRSLDFPDHHVIAKDDFNAKDDFRPSNTIDVESTVLFNIQSQKDQVNPSLPQPTKLLERSERDNNVVDIFEATEIPRIFALKPQYQSELGTFCGALESIAAGNLITLIINRSQLAPSVLATLTSISKTFEFQWLSQSLLVTSQRSSAELWQVINATLHQDAVLCLVHENAVKMESLVEHANSLGYPSLFRRHIADLSSPARLFFAKLGIQVLFESGRDGKIYVFR